MEQKDIKFFKITLIVIAAGIWINLLLNFGLVETTQKVRVINGISVDGTVDVENVDNVIDVNIQEINGRNDVFYDFGGNGKHVRLPVMTTYPNGY